jgi:hypothetical protein
MEDDHHVYTPMPNALAALGAYVVMVWLAGEVATHMSGSLRPILPPASIAHVFFWMLLFLSPLVLASIGLSHGVSYELTGSELVVRRFGSIRTRLPLDRYQGRTVIGGVLRLAFSDRSVFLLGSPDPARQKFLDAFDAQARANGAASAPSAERVGEHGVRVRLSQLQFPDGCVVCEAKATRRIVLRAVRGIEVPPFLIAPSVDVGVPACARHSRMHRGLRFGLPLAAFVLGTCVTALVLACVVSHPSTVGVFVVGMVGGSATFPLGVVVRLDALADWIVLGVRASAPSADLVHVTLRVRSAVLREAILASAHQHDA